MANEQKPMVADAPMMASTSPALAGGGPQAPDNDAANEKKPSAAEVAAGIIIHY
jgi:hypothetical protein